jgi:hypothetical protein
LGNWAPLEKSRSNPLEECGDANEFAARVDHPVLEDGRVIGLLPVARVARVPRSAWEQTYLRVEESRAALTSIPGRFIVSPAHEQRRRYAT